MLSATVPDIPVIHAGQEIGSTQHPDASGSRNVVVDWEHGDSGMSDFYAQVMAARAESTALQHGDIQDVCVKGDNGIAFLRTRGLDQALVCLDFSANMAHFEVKLPSDPKYATPPFVLHDAIGKGTVSSIRTKSGQLALTLEPYGCRIYHIEHQSNQTHRNLQ